ncbi:hypothetical protein GWI33_008256 [Rhynchophorus ferrugineus]|uniref:Uncharacterized protein n=1 Tax=Rhynchophorus ferrugineus TaxID=354439 RepID=A0A834IGX6_RHYFE|nr:hypothetical protein GWI33_008256 [Rhynchophorus ferrugineus]
MLLKLAFLSCILGLTFSRQHYNGPLAGSKPASLHPGGINPQAYQQAPAAPQYQSAQYQGYQPQARAPAEYQYNSAIPQQPKPTPKSKYTPEEQARLDRGEYIGDGDYHGEGLAEALAPGYSPEAPAPAKKVSAPVSAYYQSTQSYSQQPVQAPQTYRPAPPVKFFESVPAQQTYQPAPVPTRAYPQRTAPSYQQSAPSYQPSAPSYQQSAPSYQQSAPAYQQSAPAYSQSAPSYQKSSSSRSHSPAGNSGHVCGNYPYCY